ncbi:MAG: hypothetical protein DRJ46_04925 [Thermoprotei archaeon]|nr:MAG: hypothetical protein DRJ46_04925 [Thermoprotei archaeon]
MSDAQKKLAMTLLPLGYGWHSRLTKTGGARNALLILFNEWGAIIYSTLILHIAAQGNAPTKALILLSGEVLQTALLLLLYFTMLYSIYDIGYIINDKWAIKNEENPTIRAEIGQINYHAAILSRTAIYALGALAATYVLNAATPHSVLTATGLLLAGIVFHNLAKKVTHKGVTVINLRLAKYAYTPYLVLQNPWYALPVLLVTLPELARFTVIWTANKAAKSKGRSYADFLPRHYAYLVFLPLQLLFLYPQYLLLLGYNAALAALGLAKQGLAKIKRRAK